jgi:DNA (cytosine-5)-methyltransferase 1
VGRKKSMRAIDLYSGIGGWSLGLRLAGVDVVGSYEWWGEANQTNSLNNGHPTTECDVRSLPLSELPDDIDIVVGSPPCTQFSFANRGGRGDIADGLRDLACFLRIVSHVRPRFWALENVPRVATIMERELRRGGALAEFGSLSPSIEVVDACEWGVPQRRRRCIIGNIDFDLLREYRRIASRRSLGDVVAALRSRVIRDPVYGTSIPRSALTDHEPEEPLNAEEARMNREMKMFHPVYNNMTFPDPLSRPARTVTAVCTRVSRESIVIDAPETPGRFRRLTVRERACLQSFPLNYRLFGSTYANKIRMVGNAVPPLLTCFIAHTMLGTRPEQIPSLSKAVSRYTPPRVDVPRTPPETSGQSYSSTRRFRAALPNLRFKSGVRFELGNAFESGKMTWSVRFFFGNSKQICEQKLGEKLAARLLHEFEASRELRNDVEEVVQYCRAIDVLGLQRAWCHEEGPIAFQGCVKKRKAPAASSRHPYEVVDALGEFAARLMAGLSKVSTIESVLESTLSSGSPVVGFEKLRRHSAAVCAGLLVGSAANQGFGNGPVASKRRKSVLA